MYSLSMSRKYAPNRIRELRKSAGLSMEELGLRMRNPVTLNTIAKLEKQEMGLTLDYIVEISDVLGVSPAEIVGGGLGIRTIPVLGAIAAGNWAEELAFAEDHVPIPAGVGGPNCFALKPQGQSMNRLVIEGGFVVIDPDQKDLIDGKHYAVRNGAGEATCKTFRASPPRLEPCSTDPSFQPIMIGQEPFIVIGRAIFVGSEV